MPFSDQSRELVLLAVYELSGGRTGRPVPVSEVANHAKLSIEETRQHCEELKRTGHLYRLLDKTHAALAPNGKTIAASIPPPEADSHFANEGV